MNLDDLLSNGQLLSELARSAGVGTGEARSGLEALLPAITRGLARNASSTQGLDALAGALGSGRHDRYLDAPDQLAEPQTRIDGNAILGHIFGSKDVSRNVAAHAAQETGLDSNLLKQLLPLVASLAMGALSKRSDRGGSLQSSQASGSDLLGSILGGLAGGGGGRAQTNDSALDDILDLAKAFF